MAAPLALPLLLALPVSLQEQDPTLLLTIDSPGPERFFGATITPTQDLDGDGRGDLGFGMSAGTAGRFQIRSTATQGVLLDVAGDRVGFFAYQIGDSTGDGIGELLTNDVANGQSRHSIIDPVTGALVTELTAANGSFDVGSPLWYGPGPDVNGDGEIDLWTRTRTGGSGSMDFFEVRSGAQPDQLLYTLTTDLTSANRTFTSAVALSDMDGDGIGDWLTGDDTIVQTFPKRQRGRIQVLSGATGARILEVRGDDIMRDFGRVVANGGDINGDGVDDLLAYARRGNIDLVDVYSGADGTLLHRLQDPLLGGANGMDTDFGQGFTGLGDVDGDGVRDIGVGAPGDNEFLVNAGAAYVFSGATGELLASTTGLEISAFMGSAIAPAGDLNGDGRDDWYVGSSYGGPNPNTLGIVEGYGLVDNDLVLGFERGDDLARSLPNGAAVDDLARFGRRVRISAEGVGVAGPAVFDSAPGGPNAAAMDQDLLVDRGNLLVLQGNARQSIPGIYDTPDDAAAGGLLRIELIQQAQPRSIVLVDIDGAAPVTDVIVSLVDAAGRERVYTVPGGFTTDGVLDPARAARTLHLDTLRDQPGASSVATANQDADFDDSRVTLVEVELFGSGAVDDLRLSPGETSAVDASRLISTITSPVGNSQFGRAVVALGDVDRDGRGDIAVGSASAAGEPFGRVTVHRGLDGALLNQINGPAFPAGQGTFGSAVAAIEDLDGDGVTEVVVGAFRDRVDASGVAGFTRIHGALSGAEIGLVEAAADFTNFGASVAAVNDHDMDGVQDFVVGENFGAGGLGTLHLFSGADRSLIRSIDGDSDLIGLGSSLVNLGDVDGDGFDDVGGFTDTSFSSQPSSAFQVRSLQTGAVLFEDRGVDMFDTPGWRSAAMGDVNGDGRADFVYVTRGQLGTLRVISGIDGAVLHELVSQLPGTVLDIDLCTSPGDLDGDGIHDVVYAGVEPDVGPVPGERFVAARSGADFHELFRRRYPNPISINDVDPAGDVDGDGFGDVAVSLRGVIGGEPYLEILGYDRQPATVVCVAEPNSGGFGTRLRLTGSRSVAANAMELEVQNLPAGSFAIVAVAEGLGMPPIVSDGRLCLGESTTLRLPGMFGGAPIVSVAVDLTALPTAGAPGSTAAAVAGETRYFQAWYRDRAGATGNNLSDAIAVTFTR